MMSEDSLEADYVIVGAGVAGMAFADTLLTDSDASMIIVDRRPKPGGHWIDAYPFVRLHAPAANYGVNSRALGSNRIDETGLNRGLYELAGGPEICTYYDAVMQERLIPSGRVTYLPLSEFSAHGFVTSIDGARTRLNARRKIVDATFAETRLPATHPPSFSVSPDARCVSPTELAQRGEPCAGYVIIGAGKTAIDTVLWLLEQGRDPDAITWIRPRDPWLLNRRNVQPSLDFFADTIGALAAEMEAAREASSLDDLFARLEAGGLLRRIDPTVTPTMYRCATVSDAELEQLRRVTHVIRLGHVKTIGADQITLERGTIPTSPRHVHVHCSADGIPKKPAEPIFQGKRIVLQYIRRCSPPLSAAFIAHVEATLTDDAEKNALCTPIPVPDEPLDWLRMHLLDGRNRLAWQKSPDLRRWLTGARLDRFSAMIASVGQNPAPEYAAILERYRQAAQPGLARLAELLQPALVPCE